MATVFAQWVDAFDSETEKTGCTVTVSAPQTYVSLITSTIGSANDAEDQATANITTASNLPAGSEGRVRFWFQTPETFDLLDNSVIWQARNAAGPMLEIFVTANQKLNVFTVGNAVVGPAQEGIWTESTVLAADTEYVVEYAWRKNDYHQLWLNGVSVWNYEVSGSTGDAVTTAVRVGIDHYDGSDTNGWTAKHRLFQLADDADASLTDPPSRLYKRLYGPAQLTGSAADLYTCPADTVARILNIHASNPSGSPVDINLSIGADAAATRIFEDRAVAADSILQESYPYELAAGEKLQGWADSAGTVVVSITGYEEPA